MDDEQFKNFLTKDDKPIVEKEVKEDFFMKRFKAYEEYVKGPIMVTWCLNVVKLSSDEFIIYQGGYENVWGRFKRNRKDIWNHMKLMRRMHRALGEELFND